VGILVKLRLPSWDLEYPFIAAGVSLEHSPTLAAPEVEPSYGLM
jgi:hypothetical protein